MATTKRASTKKPVARKAAVKRTTAKKAVKMRSFHLAAEARPFITKQVTVQTYYWVVLLVFIVIVQLLILQMEFNAVTALNALG